MHFIAPAHPQPSQKFMFCISDITASSFLTQLFRKLSKFIPVNSQYPTRFQDAETLIKLDTGSSVIMKGDELRTFFGDITVLFTKTGPKDIFIGFRYHASMLSIAE